MEFDWQAIAFGSKKPLRDLQATFIAAPRELSAKRFAELAKAYLPGGNILLGLAKEAYIDGFAGQPQFQTLQRKTVAEIIRKVSASSAKHKVYILTYLQRELPYILEKISPKRVVLVNGSWRHMFHTTPAYYVLMNRHIPYEMISPFCDEADAKAYEKSHTPDFSIKPSLYTAEEMLALAHEAATMSFDYSFQTGATLGKKSGRRYRFILSAFNKVVPYQTYALHFGNSRELNFSPPNDQNYYDTIHAETYALLLAQQQKLDLGSTTLFVNLLPCPACARFLSQSNIDEIVYQADHSEGYAIKLLEQAGKKVRRLIV